MYEIKTYQNKMKDIFVNNLTGTFPNCEKRLSIWAEVDKFKWKEDESVWNQAKGKTAPQYEVHFDSEFVCFLDSGKSDKYNVYEFLLNIKKLYQEGKIYVHTEMYAVKEAELQEKRDKDVLEIPEATNEGEAIMVEVIKKQAKRKKRKTKIKKN